MGITPKADLKAAFGTGDGLNKNAFGDLVDTMLDTNLHSVNDTYTVRPFDKYITANGTFVITLPHATGSSRILMIKNNDTGTVTVDAYASEVIDGAANLALTENMACIIIDVAVGVWEIIALKAASGS
jgi:hypothetical protein